MPVFDRMKCSLNGFVVFLLCLTLNPLVAPIQAGTEGLSPEDDAAQAMCLDLSAPTQLVGAMNVVIDGVCGDAGAAMPEDLKQPILLIKNSSNITVENVDFLLNGENESAIAIVNSTEVSIRGNTFSGKSSAKALVHGRSVNGGEMKEISIENNVFRDSNSIAIMFDSWKFHPDRSINALTIKANSFSNVYQGIRFVQSEDFSRVENLPKGIRILNNELKNIAHVGILAMWSIDDSNQISGNRLQGICVDTNDKCNAISCEYCLGGRITDNLVEKVRNCKGCKGDGAGIILDWAHKDSKYPSAGVVVSRNVISDCRHEHGGGGIIVWKARGAAVYSNVISASRAGVLLMNRETKDNTIYNNEISGCEVGLFIKEGAADNEIYNNIIDGNDIDVVIQGRPNLNSVKNNHFDECKGCKNVVPLKMFEQHRCAGGIESTKEPEEFVDLNGQSSSNRPIGARLCQD